MKMTRACGRGGLTLTELLILAGTVGFIIVFVLPVLARRKASAASIACISNLKQIGLGLRMWANDNGDEFPWRVSTNRGGSKEFIETGEVICHFVALSNELLSPRLLVCWRDRERVRATSFVARLSNRNVSYFIGPDADEKLPQTILSGDRNIVGGRFTNANVLLVTSNRASWDRSIHNKCGNIGLGDGSVQSTTTESLRKLVASDQMVRQTNDTRLVMPLTP